ncbi:hypothetical protein R69919_05456 [Paraburkholderia gardini]|nr:hypothetical protein R69919_05456 [Paraburkholderia gardini]
MNLPGHAMGDEPRQPVLRCVLLETFEPGEGIEAMSGYPVDRRQHGQHAQYGIGNGHAFEHIDAIFQKLAGRVQIVELVQHFAEQRRRETRGFGGGAAALVGVEENVAADAFDLDEPAFQRIAEPRDAAAVQRAGRRAHERRAVDEKWWRFALNPPRLFIVAATHVDPRKQVIATAHGEAVGLGGDLQQVWQHRHRLVRVVALDGERRLQQDEAVTRVRVAFGNIGLKAGEGCRAGFEFARVQLKMHHP